MAALPFSFTNFNQILMCIWNEIPFGLKCQNMNKKAGFKEPIKSIIYKLMATIQRMNSLDMRINIENKEQAMKSFGNTESIIDFSTHEFTIQIHDKKLFGILHQRSAGKLLLSIIHVGNGHWIGNFIQYTSNFNSLLWRHVLRKWNDSFSWHGIAWSTLKRVWFSLISFHSDATINHHSETDNILIKLFSILLNSLRTWNKSNNFWKILKAKIFNVNVP